MTGTVEAKSKAGTGLLIGGKWHNADKKSGVSFESVTKGDNVEVEVNDAGFITKLTVNGKATVVATNGNSKPAYVRKDDPNTRLEIARGTAVKAVLSSPSVAGTLNTADYSQMVSEVKGLILEMTNYVLTGTFNQETK